METNTNDKKEEDFPEAVKLDSGNSVKSDSKCDHRTIGVESTLELGTCKVCGKTYNEIERGQIIIKEYMHDLAMKSVAVQAVKYGKKKFAEMGKRSGISKRKKIREKLKAIGETVEGLTLK